MPLQKQPYALQFQGGLDTKTDSKQVGYAKLLDLQNAVFTKKTTLVKRNGYRSLGSRVETTLAAVASPKGIATRGGELIEFAGGRAYSYLDVTEAERTPLATERALAQLRGAQWAATAQLVKALGGGWTAGTGG